MSSTIITILVIAGAVLLGIAMAYLPMRLVVSQIARHVQQFIQRQRDRRRVARGTPDRRKEQESPAPGP